MCTTSSTTCIGGLCSGQCAPGQTTCSGDTPQTCSAGTWTDEATCAQPSPDCSDGSCTCLETLCSGTCTPLTTTTNCGACGNVCSQTNATTVGCNGTACTYACGAGFADCNTASDNTGGCACHAASTAAQGTVGGCCSQSCQTQHDNGVGGNYYDCTALSTYNVTQATEAANSDTAQAGSVSTGTCGTAPNLQSAVFRTAGDGSTGACTAWVYAGSGTYASSDGGVVNLADTVGTVFVSTGTGTEQGCYCGLSTTVNWN